MAKYDEESVKIAYNELSKNWDVGTLDEFKEEIKNAESLKIAYNELSKNWDVGKEEEFRQRMVPFDPQQLVNAVSKASSQGVKTTDIADAVKAQGQKQSQSQAQPPQSAAPAYQPNATDNYLSQPGAVPPQQGAVNPTIAQPYTADAWDVQSQDTYTPWEQQHDLASEWAQQQMQKFKDFKDNAQQYEDYRNSIAVPASEHTDEARKRMIDLMLKEPRDKGIPEETIRQFYAKQGLDSEEKWKQYADQLIDEDYRKRMNYVGKTYGQIIDEPMDIFRTELAKNKLAGQQTTQQRMYNAAPGIADEEVYNALEATREGNIVADPEKALKKALEASERVAAMYGLDAKNLNSQVTSKAYDELIRMRVPKNAAENIIVGGLKNSAVGRMVSAGVNTDFERMLDNMAQMEYDKEVGLPEEVLKGIATFAADSWMYLGAGATVGRVVEGGVSKIISKRIADRLIEGGMERALAQQTATRVMNMVPTVGQRAARQMAHGAGTFAATGALEGGMAASNNAGQKVGGFGQKYEDINPAAYRVAYEQDKAAMQKAGAPTPEQQERMFNEKRAGSVAGEAAKSAGWGALSGAAFVGGAVAELAAKGAKGVANSFARTNIGRLTANGWNKVSEWAPFLGKFVNNSKGVISTLARAEIQQEVNTVGMTAVQAAEARAQGNKDFDVYKAWEHNRATLFGLELPNMINAVRNFRQNDANRAQARQLFNELNKNGYNDITDALVKMGSDLPNASETISYMIEGKGGKIAGNKPALTPTQMSELRTRVNDAVESGKLTLASASTLYTMLTGDVSLQPNAVINVGKQTQTDDGKWSVVETDANGSTVRERTFDKESSAIKYKMQRQHAADLQRAAMLEKAVDVKHATDNIDAKIDEDFNSGIGAKVAEWARINAKNENGEELTAEERVILQNPPTRHELDVYNAYQVKNGNIQLTPQEFARLQQSLLSHYISNESHSAIFTGIFEEQNGLKPGAVEDAYKPMTAEERDAWAEAHPDSDAPYKYGDGYTTSDRAELRSRYEKAMQDYISDEATETGAGSVREGIGADSEEQETSASSESQRTGIGNVEADGGAGSGSQRTVQRTETVDTSGLTGQQKFVAETQNRVTGNKQRGFDVATNNNVEGAYAINQEYKTAEARIDRVFADDTQNGQVKKDVVNMVMSGRMAQAHTYINDVREQLTDTQREALEKYVDASTAMLGIDEGVNAMIDGDVEAYEQSMSAVVGEDGNIHPIAISGIGNNDMQRAYIKSGNPKNKFGTVLVAVEQPDGTFKSQQVATTRIIAESAEEPVSLADVVKQYRDRLEAEAAVMWQNRFDGIEYQQEQKVQMNFGAGNFEAIIEGRDAKGDIIVSNGEHKQTMSRAKVDQAVKAANEYTIAQTLTQEASQRMAQEAQRKAAAKQAKYTRDIVGWTPTARPEDIDLTAQGTKLQTVAEWLSEIAQTEGTSAKEYVETQKAMLVARQQQLEQQLREVNLWYDINSGRDMPEEADYVAKIETINKEIRDIDNRWNRWNEIRSRVMTPEEKVQFAKKRQADIDASVKRVAKKVQEGNRNYVDDDAVKIDGRGLPVDKEGEVRVGVMAQKDAENWLLGNYRTMDEANTAVNRQWDDVARNIRKDTDLLLTNQNKLAAYKEGRTDLTATELDAINGAVHRLTERINSAKQEQAGLNKLDKRLEKIYEERNQLEWQEDPGKGRMDRINRRKSPQAKLSQAQTEYKDYPDATAILDHGLEPQTIEEYVSTIGAGTLSWDGYNVDGHHVRGLKEELGGMTRSRFGKRGDTYAFDYMLAKKSDEGMGIDELAHKLAEDSRWSEGEIKEAILNVLMGASRPEDIKNMIINNRIEEAESAARYQDEAEEDARINAQQDETAGVGMEGEFVDPFDEANYNNFDFALGDNEEATRKHNEAVAKHGGLIQNEGTRTVDFGTARLLDSVGRQTGKTVVIKTAQEMWDGLPESYRNKFRSKENLARAGKGYTELGTNRIVLNGAWLSAQENPMEEIRFVLGHETTHVIKSLGTPETWNAYVEAVKTAMGRDFDRELSSTRRRYDGMPGYTGADKEQKFVEEVCADFAGNLRFRTDADVDKFLNQLDAAGMDMSAFADAIRRMLEMLQSLEDMANDLKDAGLLDDYEVEDITDYTKEAMKKWDKLYDEAAKKIEARKASEAADGGADWALVTDAKEIEAQVPSGKAEGTVADKAFGYAKTEEEFDKTLQRAKEGNGIVQPNLAAKHFDVLSIDKHPFSGTGRQAIEKARDWALKNLVGEHTAHKGQANEFKYVISDDVKDGPIGKYLSQSATKNSANLGVHLAALMRLPEIIESSIDCEIHADYKKGKDGRGDEIQSDDLLMHRLYGALKVKGDDTLYRTKTTIKEYRNKDNEPYTYEITKIDSPISGSTSSDALGDSTFVIGAKLLKDVEKTKEKGKKLLGNDKKVANQQENTENQPKTTDGDVRWALDIKERDPWLSNAAEGVRKIKQEKATGEQWVKMLQKNGGLKAEEDKWIGLSDYLLGGDVKEKQAEIISKSNPKDESLGDHTWITSADDILTFDEALTDFVGTPDYTLADAEKAQKAGKIKVYSSYPIKNGTFVTPSMMEAKNYAGEGTVYEKTVNTKDVAWIDSNQGQLAIADNTFTRQEVMDYINKNAVKIEDVNYGGMNFPDRFNDPIEQEIADYIQYCVRMGDDAGTALGYAYNQITDAPEESVGWTEEKVDNVAMYVGLPINDTRLGYTTHGLRNNREIAMIVPGIEPYKPADKTHFGDAGYGRAVVWTRFGDATAKSDAKKAVENFGKSMMEKYGTDEYDTVKYLDPEEKATFDNLIDHLKEAEKTDAKVLVIDELQSKRHQDGRDEGYQTISTEKAHALQDEFSKKMSEKYSTQNFFPKMTEEERTEWNRLERQVRNSGGVPDAPFRKNWMEVGMKRMLRYAAENGYDKLAWTTGAQQAERYNIGRKVKTISTRFWTKNGENSCRILDYEGDQIAHMGYNRAGEVTFCNEMPNVIGKPLSDVLGKELAEQIINADNLTDFHPRDMQLGGEGMKGFYDGMMVKFMDKYCKKWGVKTQDVELNLPNTADRVMHSVDITPEMKEDILDGQLMWALVGEIGAKNLDEAAKTELMGQDKDERMTNIGNLGTAREMTNRGYDAEAIKYATGWERGADGKWKLETNDLELRYRPDGDAMTMKDVSEDASLTLNDIVRNDNGLFAAYPELRNVNVDGRIYGPTLGQYSYSTNTVSLNMQDYERALLSFDNAVKNVEEWKNPTAEAIANAEDFGFTKEQAQTNAVRKAHQYASDLASIEKSLSRVLAHEIQHYIQRAEGFAKGGNTGLFEQASADEKEVLNNTLAEMKSIGYDINKLTIDQLLSAKRDGHANNLWAAMFAYADQMKEPEKSNALRFLTQQERNALDVWSSVGGEKARETYKQSGSMEAYRDLAGEVESRTVSDRYGLSTDERYESLASADDDVERENQIIMFALVNADTTTAANREAWEKAKYSTTNPKGIILMRDGADYVTFGADARNVAQSLGKTVEGGVLRLNMGDYFKLKDQDAENGTQRDIKTEHWSDWEEYPDAIKDGVWDSNKYTKKNATEALKGHPELRRLRQSIKAAETMEDRKAAVDDYVQTLSDMMDGEREDIKVLPGARAAFLEAISEANEIADKEGKVTFGVEKAVSGNSRSRRTRTQRKTAGNGGKNGGKTKTQKEWQQTAPSDKEIAEKIYEDPQSMEFTTGEYYEGDNQELAHAIKRGETGAIKEAARRMSLYLNATENDTWAALDEEGKRHSRETTVIVPVPSHTGKATYTLKLAKELSKLTGVPVADALHSKPYESSYDRKARGEKPEVPEMELTDDVDVQTTVRDANIVLLIDNVEATGDTMFEAEKGISGHMTGSVIRFPFVKDSSKSLQIGKNEVLLSGDEAKVVTWQSRTLPTISKVRNVNASKNWNDWYEIGMEDADSLGGDSMDLQKWLDYYSEDGRVQLEDMVWEKGLSSEVINERVEAWIQAFRDKLEGKNTNTEGSIAEPWENVKTAMIHTSNMRRRAPQLWEAAKHGDVKAATELVETLVKPARVAHLANKHPNAVVAYPHYEDTAGKNAIPAAYADLLGTWGFEVDDRVVQKNRVYRTDATRYDRLMNRARFGGEVQEGREYILVDDHITSGATLRDMKDYIESKGGKVVAWTALEGSAGATNVELSEENLNKLTELGVTDEQVRKLGISRSTRDLTNQEARELIALSQRGRDFRTPEQQKKSSRRNTQVSRVNDTSKQEGKAQNSDGARERAEREESLKAERKRFREIFGIGDDGLPLPEADMPEAKAKTGSIKEARQAVDKNPTDGQKKAGNYKMGHIKLDGYNITLENAKGSVRSGKDADGKEWSVTMQYDYGYLRGTEGVDGDHIDVFLSDTPESGNVYVVDQVNKDGSFDEHKVMYGFNSIDEAKAAYLSNYEEGWQGLGNITEVTKDIFKKWVDSSHRKTKPFADYVIAKDKAVTGETRETQDGVDNIAKVSLAKGMGVTVDAPNVKAKTYRGKNGRRTNYVQLTLDFDAEPDTTSEPKEKTPVDFRFRELQDGELCYVERRYTESGVFNFDGTEKVKSADDVAYIFRSLEDMAIEHTFYVLIKAGKPTVIHAGMGNNTGSMIDVTAATLAIDNIQPDAIFMVHNHPSGTLSPSSHDNKLWSALGDMYGSKLQDGIIIDQKSGKYATFNPWEIGKHDRPQTIEDAKPIKTYTFDRSVFARNYVFDDNRIDDAEKVAAFVSSHRLGNRGKLGVLLASNNMTVNGNIMLPYNELKKDNLAKIVKSIISAAHAMNGTVAMMYGSGGMGQKELSDLSNMVKRHSGGSVRLMDAIRIEGRTQDATSLLYGVAEPPTAEERRDMARDRVSRMLAGEDIRFALSDGRPRKKRGESDFDYNMRLMAWQERQERLAEVPPAPDLNEFIGRWEQQYEEDYAAWKERHGLTGEISVRIPPRATDESLDDYLERVRISEKWKEAVNDTTDPMPIELTYYSKAQEEHRQALRQWEEDNALQEQEEAAMNFYEGTVFGFKTPVTPVEAEPKGKSILIETEEENQRYLQETAESRDKQVGMGRAEGFDSSPKGARRAVKIATIKRRQMIDSMGAESAIFIHNLKNDLKEAAKKIGMSADQLNEQLPDIIESRTRLAQLIIDAYLDMRGYPLESVTVKRALPTIFPMPGEMPAIGDNLVDDIRKVMETLSETENGAIITEAVHNYELFLNPELQPVLDKVRNWYDEYFLLLEENGMLNKDTGRVKDYVNHVWDKEKSDPSAWQKYVEPYQNLQRTNSSNVLKRELTSYAHGREVGLVPKYENITDMIARYSRDNIKAIANRSLLNYLGGLTIDEYNSDGEYKRTLDVISSEQPTNNDDMYEIYKVPGYGYVWVHKDVHKRFGVLFGEVENKDDHSIKTAFLHGWDLLADAAKRAELSLSGFHMLALSEVAWAQRDPISTVWDIVKYIVYDSVAAGTTPALAHPEDFKDAAKHLVQLGSTADYAYEAGAITGKFRELANYLYEKNKAAGSVPLTLTTLIDWINTGMDEALWTYVHDGLKIAGFKAYAKRIRERAAKERWSETQLDHALNEAGQYINDTYGGQHWEILNVSPSTLRWLRRALLSPDWGMSTARHFLSMFGFGSLYSESSFTYYVKNIWAKARGKKAPEKAEEDFGRIFRMKMANWCYLIGIAFFTYPLWNLINADNVKKDEKEQKRIADEIRKTNPDYKSPYELKYPDGMKWYHYTMLGGNTMGQKFRVFGGRYPDGRERYYRPGKQYQEVPEYVIDDKDNISIPWAFFNRIGAKANPMLILAYEAGKIASGKGLDPETEKIIEKHGKNIAFLSKAMRTFMPFSASQMLDGEFALPNLFVPSRRGYTRYKALDDYEESVEMGDTARIKEITEACIMNNLDPNSLLTAAEKRVEAKLQTMRLEGIESLDDAMKAFNGTNNIKDRKKIKSQMTKFMAESQWKSFTPDQAVENYNMWREGVGVNDTTKIGNLYIGAISAEDVRDDITISTAKKASAEDYKIWQNMSDAAEKEKYYHAHQMQMETYNKIKNYESVLRDQKKLLGKGNDEKLATEMRKRRKQVIIDINAIAKKYGR